MLARTERPIALHELVQVLFRYKSRVLLWCLLALGLSLAALVVLPRKYESEAKLFLRLGRESVTLDPTATTGTMIQVQESRENQINSTREMLKSRALLERVVEKLGAETILKGPPGPLRQVPMPERYRRQILAHATAAAAHRARTLAIGV